MIRLLGAGVRHALKLNRPGRRLPVKPDDILLASYRDSGNIWAQLLVANLAHPEQNVSPRNLHRLILDPDRSTKRDFDDAPKPRVVRSNGSFDPRYRRVVYVVRDPREVAALQISELSKAGADGSKSESEEGYIRRFVADGGVTSPNFKGDSGSWGENVGSWIAACLGKPGFLLLRHEDLRADTGRELRRVGGFVGLRTDDQRLAQAVESAAIVRPAQSDWRNKLSEAEVAGIEGAWGEIMACLGYELLTRDARRALDHSLIGLLAAGAVR